MEDNKYSCCRHCVVYDAKKHSSNITCSTHCYFVNGLESAKSTIDLKINDMVFVPTFNGLIQQYIFNGIDFDFIYEEEKPIEGIDRKINLFTVDSFTDSRLDECANGDIVLVYNQETDSYKKYKYLIEYDYKTKNIVQNFVQIPHTKDKK